LSVSTQKLPSGIALMPEKPCTGCPLNGSDTPVGRGADLSERNEVPAIDSGASRRLPSGAVYLPEIRMLSGASFGGGMIVFAGRYA
jgi:hypothetical protein